MDGQGNATMRRRDRRVLPINLSLTFTGTPNGTRHYPYSGVLATTRRTMSDSHRAE